MRPVEMTVPSAMVVALVLALGGTTAEPLTAQPARPVEAGTVDAAGISTAGVFQQAHQTNPFVPLLREQGALLTSFSVGASNNTLDIGNMVGLGHMASDFQFSDVFLVGGLIPAGERPTVRSHDRAMLTVAIPTGIGTFGLTAGARAHALAEIPGDVAGLARDGSTTDDLHLEFGDFRMKGVAYSDVGLLGLFNAYRDSEKDRRVRVGVGAHYLLGLVSGDVRLNDGATGDGTRGSSVTFAHDGVRAEVVGQAPLGASEPGGTGYALDFYMGANLGSDLYLGALLTSLGQVTVNVDESERWDTSVNAESVGDFFDTMDTLSTDTIPATTEKLTLPAVLRLEGSYSLTSRLGLGAAVEAGFGDPFASGSLVQGLVELRPLRWLPLRFGMSHREPFGSGFHAGMGIDASHLELNVDLGLRGGTSIDASRSARLQTSLGVYF